eukprot:TRINITY_DN1739_c1_g1_i1.p1 TRINITY_DN1739_c1_g1~~TRINITY_DN1739_c1_g1_i1.p1  ORF type:complete len:610 (+),score=133.81 TRINITY_DN1739_c1_g1_i1:137-1966(+)
MLATSAGPLAIEKRLPAPPPRVLNGKENAPVVRSKENIQNVIRDKEDSLKGSLPEIDNENEDDEKRAEFEQLVLGDYEVDVAQAWCDYIQWASERFPASGEDARLIHRACAALACDSRHRDDVRHVRLWVRYASKLETPQEVFESLEAKGIGSRHALRYEAYAVALERQHIFDKAEHQYHLGIERNAQPTERLRGRLEEFHERMRKRAAREERRKKVKNVEQQVVEPITPMHREHRQDEKLQPCEDLRPVLRELKPIVPVQRSEAKSEQLKSQSSCEVDELPQQSSLHYPTAEPASKAKFEIFDDTVTGKSKENSYQDGLNRSGADSTVIGKASNATSTRPQDEKPLPSTLAPEPERQASPSPESHLETLVVEDISFEELQAARVLARLGGQATPSAEPSSVAAELADTPSAASPQLSPQSSVHSGKRRESQRRASFEGTQELTTSGVRALLGDCTPRHSMASARLSSRGSLNGAFDDPTITMEWAKNEVLDLLAHDPDHNPPRNESPKVLMRVGAPKAGSVDGGGGGYDGGNAAHEPEKAARLALAPLCSAGKSYLFGTGAASSPSSATPGFEIFEETGSSENNFLGRRSSGGIQIWNDSEFDAATGD